MELLGHGQRTVAADAHQPFDTQLVDGGLHAFQQFGIEFDPVGNADRRGKPALVGRAEDCTALVENARGVFRGECDVAHRIIEALVALEKSHAIVSQLPRGFHRAANYGVESRTIAAAGENSDTLL